MHPDSTFSNAFPDQNAIWTKRRCHTLVFDSLWDRHRIRIIVQQAIQEVCSGQKNECGRIKNKHNDNI